ncbi:MAG TPA: hypothetical protein VGV60_12790 [Candidatus Polarisedimenticolia bacterium]|jgi:hypothetical protein|nr:hypothetical protein [Candidatus Polarisedimenticolia bacterium]
MSWSSGTRYSFLDSFVALDDFDYPQFRTFYGYISDGGYVSMHRNSERNKAILNIDLRAQKAFVLGKINSRLFISVQNLLNRDDLTILGAVPGGSAIRPNTQLDAVRRFGRRYEVGFHFAF